MSTTKTRGWIVLTGMLLTMAGSFQIRAAEPMTIATGFDTLALTPAQILASADQFAEWPFDGIAFPLRESRSKESPYDNPSLNHHWSLAEMERKFGADCREIVKRKGLRHSFLHTYFAPAYKAIRWQSDADWARFSSNLRTFAAFAKACGFEGLALDTEDYFKVCQFELKRDEGLKYDEAVKLARKRGAEVFRGVFEEFPDIKIVTYWWLSFRGAYRVPQTGAAFARGLGDLLPAFTDGLLDVMPLTARFYDGNEHTYHAAFDTSALSQRIAHQALVSPENRMKFRACTGAAGAFYLDMYINPEFYADGSRAFYKGPVGGRRLNHFLDRFEDAKYDSEFIWVYGEKRSFVDWKIPPEGSRFSAAFTNGTWDASLPGFNAELKILRNPQAELLPRLRAAKAAGTAVDLATELKTTDDGYNYEMDVKGTKYGEWYAVLVEMKSIHPDAGITLKRGAYTIWTRPTAPIVFSEPNKDGIRRGIAFQRIWGDADALHIHCGYNDYIRTKPENLKVSVYKVFTP